ncbi:MAG: twin-arginine translocase TatA/TatE family subunit [Thermodesulfobacteriota bacterium]
MFGIGLPELILIMALALIVVGPDKLPDLARSLAKQLLELKKTAAALKESLEDELREERTGGGPLQPLSEAERAALPGAEHAREQQPTGTTDHGNPTTTPAAVDGSCAGTSIEKDAGTEAKG